MGETEKKEVKRELILALMILVLFVSLIVTWTVLGAVDSYVAKTSEGKNIPRTTGYAPEGTGRIALGILPHEKGGEE